HGPTVPRRLHVSSISVLDEAQVFHSGLRLADIPSMPGFAALLARAYRTRGFGDFWQHILVAEGAGEIAIDPVMKPWDIGPLLVIVEEAGGRSTSLEGRASVDGGSLLTTNGLLHEEALAILRGGSSEGGEEDGMQGPAR
ncbi:MAG: inositol monophosphatase family protein, partial [Candidatus Eisenbacteria bacterium]|nr:inositol monophosphatase family protein [Candidatus Eisenbacteria bacterium]